MHRDWTTRRPRASTPSLEFLATELASPPALADERFFHEDLPGRTDDELRLERRQRHLAVLLSEYPSPWVLERLDRIECEMERRHVR